MYVPGATLARMSNNSDSPLDPIDPDKADELLNDTPATPLPKDALKDPKLQQMLQEYQTAIRQEFDIEEHPELADREKFAEKIGEKLDKIVGKAIIQIEDLIENASSESVRANLSKWVIQQRLGEAVKNPSDPIGELFKQLQAQTSDD